MVIDDVLDKIIDTFKVNQSLEEVCNYHKINGILPDIGTSISASCQKVTYELYDNETDEAEALILIYVYTQEADPEEGERKIRELSEIMRRILNKDVTLEGTISSGEIKEIEYIYADSSDTVIWHAAMLEYHATFYSERQKDEISFFSDDIDIEMEGM
ncbi:hypothetical protein [Clostridium lundense]|uniref:hypothetical protein n=1 Tax=Clostridium lundense TaxID=319475 RepID=UPI0004857C39|nr:hypothetical protein [Clostridium lundense]